MNRQSVSDRDNNYVESNIEQSDDNYIDNNDINYEENDNDDNENENETNLNKNSKRQIHYTHEEKERLVGRIYRLKKEKYLRDIKNIILKYNANITITSNPRSGEYLYFHNLKPETYLAIEKYIQKVLESKFLSDNNSATESEPFKNKKNNVINSNDDTNYYNQNNIFVRKNNDDTRLKNIKKL